ncbi:MAG: CRISPR-associated endonuclease Cas2 [Candidatus Aenigmatarchaeota archaeon]
MYVIIVYDVSIKRVNKVCQFLKQYLNWIQNSVFEGELSESELKRVEVGLSRIIDESEDSIIIYQLPSEKVLKRIHIGAKKEEPSSII